MKKIIRIASHIFLPSLILNAGIDSFHNNLTFALTTSSDSQIASVTADITKLKEIKTPTKSLWQFLTYWQSIINIIELETLQNSAKSIIKELREKHLLEIENSELQNSIAILNEFVQKSLDLLDAKQALPELKDDSVVTKLSSVNAWNKFLVILSLWENPQEVFTSLNESSLSISTKRKIRKFITAINDLQTVVLTKLIKLSPVLLIKFEPIPQIEKASSAANKNTINLEKQRIQKENARKVISSTSEQSQLSVNSAPTRTVETENTQPSNLISVENSTEQVINSLSKENQVPSVNHGENPLSIQQNPLSTVPTSTTELASTEKIATPISLSENANIISSPIPQTAAETPVGTTSLESKPVVSTPVLSKAEVLQENTPLSVKSRISPSPEQSSAKHELAIVEPLPKVSEKDDSKPKNPDDLEIAKKVSVEPVATERITGKSKTRTNNIESQDIETSSSSLDNDTSSKVADIPAKEPLTTMASQTILPSETINLGSVVPSDSNSEQSLSFSKLNVDNSIQQQTIDFSQCTDINNTIQTMEGLIDRVVINKLTSKQKSILKNTTDLINEIQIHSADLDKKYAALIKLYRCWEQLRTNNILNELAPKLPKSFHEKLIYSLYTEYLENINAQLEKLKNNPKFSAVHMEINTLYTSTQKDLSTISENIKTIINAPRQNIFAIKSIEENKIWEKLNNIAIECSLLENKIRNLPIRFVKRENDILNAIKIRPLFIDKLLHSKPDSAQKQSSFQRIPNSTMIKPLAAPTT